MLWGGGLDTFKYSKNFHKQEELDLLFAIMLKNNLSPISRCVKKKITVVQMISPSRGLQALKPSKGLTHTRVFTDF